MNEPETILVYPKVVSLTALGIPALRPFGDLTTSRRLVEDPMRLMGARPYASGDSYRHIHWKATAHRHEGCTRSEVACLLRSRSNPMRGVRVVCRC